MSVTRGRYVEVCAGAGGLGLGLHRAGWTGTGMEFNADAVATHNANVGPCILADITMAPTPHAADLVAAGVPCQSFSSVGNGDGLDDPRGQLFNAMLRIAVESGARVCLMENVRGLISHGALAVVTTAFRARGFIPVHALLNAMDYGVPQSRARVFIAGFRRAEDLARFQWPAPTHGAPGNLFGLPPWRTVREALELGGGQFVTGPLPHMKPGSPNGMRSLDPDKPAWTIRGSSGQDVLRPADILDRPSPCLTASEHKGCNAFGSRGAVTSARRAGDRLNPALARLGATRLSLEHCRRLQSFPDDFVFTGDKESQFKQVGNAVPVLLAEAIGRSVAIALYGEPLAESLRCA